MRKVLTVVSGVMILAVALAMYGPAVACATSVEAQARSQLGGLRVPFIANQGQVDAEVAYYAPTFAGTLFVSRRGELVYSLPRPDADAPGTRGGSLTETFRGGKVTLSGQEPGVTAVSSFIGDDPAQWRGALPTYQQLGLGEVWPGVTVSLRARGRSAEKIFTVAPGTSVDRIRVRVGGARALRVGHEGALIARTGLGDVTFTPPVAYQEHDGVRRTVPVAYRIAGREYRFTVGAYDRTRPLVIDPLLQSTYLGGSNYDETTAIAIHPASGDVYVAGRTDSINFPGRTGGAQASAGGGADVFVARLNGALTALAQATYLGGSSFDTATALAIHPTSGDVYVAGQTNSTNFPGTVGGAQESPGNTFVGDADAFVARLNATLTVLTQATYLGGNFSDFANALAIHPTSGDVYVAGRTHSTMFPSTTGGAQASAGGGGDAFVARLNAGLTTLTQATYLGGSAFDYATALAIHPASGDVYVAGQANSTNFPSTMGGAQASLGGPGSSDAFVARLNAALTALTQATYLGGTSADAALALAIHPASGDVYVAGYTSSTNFPGTLGGAQASYGGGQDAFVAHLNAALTALTQATYLGGADGEVAYALAIHGTSGDVYVAGYTVSTDFPGTLNGAQPDLAISDDAFAARLNAALTSIEQATFLGGTRSDTATALAIHPMTGEVYVAGNTGALDFPGTAGGAQPIHAGLPNSYDGFVVRLTADLTGPDLAVTKTHGGSFTQGQVGAIYLITVTNLGGSTTGTVIVTDSLPGGLAATAISGTGWNCILATLTCTRNDSLASGQSYPTITVTVSVAINAATPQTNVATVSTIGDVNPANNTAVDPTAIVAAPDLTILKAHAGTFTAGQVGASYLITVSNLGTVASAGTVTVTDSLPGGLTATAISGTGWSCILGTLTCTRTDALASGASYPAITVTVNVDANAPSSVTNTATVSGGGDASPANNTTIDPTTVATAVAGPDLTIAKAHGGSFLQGQVGATYVILVSNVGTASTSGTVTTTDTLPAGLTATAISGTGWSCLLGTLTCTRTDALTSGASYPAITVTVNVAINAPPLVTNTAAVSGGGDLNPGNNAAADLTVVLIAFIDVPSTDPFFPWIEALAGAGITGGCGSVLPMYCPDAVVTRGQLAVFLLRGLHGTGYVPPAATGALFTDVPLGHLFAPWIEQLAREGITGGCATNPSRYCPEAEVTRAEAAVLLLRAEHGGGYQPPAATGTFADVPATNPFAAWIEQLAREGITGGCGATTYCPDSLVTREQMAVFLVRLFHLPM